MKMTLTVLIILASLAAQAGKITMRGTYQSISFTLDKKNGTVELKSETELISDRVFQVITVKKEKASMGRTYTLTEAVAHDQGATGHDALGPLALVAYPVTAVADTAVLLVAKAPSKLVRQMKYNKDFKKLRKAIDEDKEVVVGEKRFKRIVGLLKKTSLEN